MPSPYFPAFGFHSVFSREPSIAQKNLRNSFGTLLRGMLGGGLFFLVALSLPVRVFAADVTLAWDPNSEADLEGYGVYFKKDAPGPPYDFFGDVALGELDDPDNPTFTLTGLEKGSRYYITLTAYDAAGMESGYADPVCAEVGDQILPCDGADPGGGSGSSDGSASLGGGGSAGSGGGGGGCFIATSSEHAKRDGMLLGLFLLAAVIFHFLQKVFTRRDSTSQPRPMAPGRASARRRTDAGDR